MRKKIGLFGGTFDPVHNGHLRVALELKQALQLDEMRLVPCHRPPHRTAPGAASNQRAAMVRLAIADCAELQIDERELRREQASYTIDTLRELREELGSEVSLVLALGTDAFIGLNTWHCWRELLNYTHLALVARPGFALPESGEVMDLLNARLAPAAVLDAQACGGIVQPSLSMLPISATAIRAQIAGELSPQFLLPDAVWQYITAEKLYQSRPVF